MNGYAKKVALAVLFSALVAPGCIEDLLDLYEPNDTYGEAADITDASPISATFGTDTVDWFKVVTTDDKEFTVTCTPAGSINDYTVTLYGVGPTWLADDDDGAISEYAQTVVYTPSGGLGDPVTYYIEVVYSGAADVEVYGLLWETAP